MSMLITILLCLALAGLLGFAIGLFWCKNSCNNKLRALEEEWQSKYNHLTHEYEEAKSRLGLIKSITDERDQLSEQLQELDSIENERDNLTASLAALETEDWPLKLKQLEQERDSLALQLQNNDSSDSTDLTSQLVITQKERDDLMLRVRALESDHSKTEAMLNSISSDMESDYEIEEIEGIGKGYGKQLRKIGISRTGDLINQCAKPDDIRPIAETMKLEDWVIGSWTSMADLCRIKGIGGQFAELLDFSGMHSVQQLAKANASGLLARITETNEKEHRVSEVPNVETVKSWIEYAKELAPMIQPNQA